MQYQDLDIEEIKILCYHRIVKCKFDSAIELCQYLQPGDSKLDKYYLSADLFHVAMNSKNEKLVQTLLNKECYDISRDYALENLFMIETTVSILDMIYNYFIIDRGYKLQYKYKYYGYVLLSYDQVLWIIEHDDYILNRNCNCKVKCTVNNMLNEIRHSFDIVIKLNRHDLIEKICNKWRALSDQFTEEKMQFVEISDEYIDILRNYGLIKWNK